MLERRMKKYAKNRNKMANFWHFQIWAVLGLWRSLTL